MRIDRKLTLQSVSLFAETPDDILSALVDLLEEIEVPAGQTVFHKGDLGDSLYIVAEGRLRVYDGDRVLNDLGKRDVFGEMAALDPEPRSATVTALEDSRLLGLHQRELYELIAQRPEVAHGLIRVLSRRLRARMRDMAEDYQYLQQFAKVTSAAVAVEAGVYEPDSLNEVARRTDELGQLARVFQRAIREVLARETNLQRQVAELRIEIDEARQARQVAEITETEYFQTLRRKANQLRSAKP